MLTNNARRSRPDYLLIIGDEGPPLGQAHTLPAMLISVILHFGLLDPPRKSAAVPFPLPLFAEKSNSICTFRSPLSWSIVPMHPLIVSTPVPVASNTPLQQKRYAPVCVLNRTTLPGTVSSTRQALKTETVKLHVAVFPELSVAVQVTEVVPTGKGEPDGGLQTTVTPGQLSVAVAVKFTVALLVGGHVAAAATKMFAGQVIVGGVVSVTVTVNEQLGPDVVVQLTVVVPTGKQLPDDGLHVTVPQEPPVVGAG